ncbi:MAG: protein jag [Treponema sp.]|jgi:spoIIIJ-associated protein|nr:protein jag [Treponema sp.]
MIYEFEGRTEKEAIDKAAAELGIEKNEFDVEILETQRSGLFKKGYVKIQVHTEGPGADPAKTFPKEDLSGNQAARRHEPVQDRTRHADSRHADISRHRTGRQNRAGYVPGSTDDLEKALVSFLEGLIERMGYAGRISVLYREESKLGLKIESENSSILIGKKGKNLDALQLLANIYAGRHGREDMRIILDSENYRLRREESLVRLAYTVADRVRESRSSVLLEPMNPFDRRLIHTTLNDISDVETKSEGEGLYKQVRVYYRGFKPGH